MVCPRCRTDNDSGSRACRLCAFVLSSDGDAETLFAPRRDAGPRDSAAGTTFAGRFRIIEEIGAGSMGAVYKAVDEKIDDVVSLKILKPGLTCDPAAVELFQNEVRLARRISHKNVCRVYDFGEESGRYFLTREYVADGLTDEITSRLSNLPELGVISRTSSMAYRKSPKTVPQIGRELGVDYILEGSVRWDPRAGRKGPMRVAAQLIAVADDTHVWTQTFDSATTDIFALQTEIAEQVARKLEVNLLEPERTKLLAPPTKDEKAYDLFFLARKAEFEIWSSWNMKDFPSVVGTYEKAVKLDPTFALAYAQVYRAMGDAAQTMVYADRARMAIEKTIENRPDDPRLRAALGLAYAYLGRSTEAIEEGNRAANLYPVSLDAAQGSIYVFNLARIHTILGDEAKAIEYRRYLLSVPMCEFLWDVLSASSLKLDPEWDSLRPQPAFKEVRERNLF